MRGARVRTGMPVGTHMSATCCFLHFVACPSASAITRLCGNMCICAAQVVTCQRLHAVLRVVLTVGNTLNYGTPRGSADGLRLDSLQKLADMKVMCRSLSLWPCSAGHALVRWLLLVQHAMLLKQAAAVSCLLTHRPVLARSTSASSISAAH